MPFDAFDIAENQARQYQEKLNAKKSKHEIDLKTLIMRHKTELPSAHIAETRVSSALKQHPRLAGIMRCLKNESKYRRIPYPSRILFTGPSGCGKTELAKSIARTCNMRCLLLNGMALAHSLEYQHDIFFDNFFFELNSNSKQNFLVILDNISDIASSSRTEKMSLYKKRGAFWNGLNSITKKRHICVIGLEHQHPAKVSDILTTNFYNNVFKFQYGNIPTIVATIKERLNFNPEDASSSNISELHNCNDTFLTSMTTRFTHLSSHEISSIIENAIMLAIEDNENIGDTVLEKHIIKAWNDCDSNNSNTKNLPFNLISRRNIACVGLLCSIILLTYKLLDYNKTQLEK